MGSKLRFETRIMDVERGLWSGSRTGSIVLELGFYTTLPTHPHGTLGFIAVQTNQLLFNATAISHCRGQIILQHKETSSMEAPWERLNNYHLSAQRVHALITAPDTSLLPPLSYRFRPFPSPLIKILVYSTCVHLNFLKACSVILEDINLPPGSSLNA